MIRVVLPAQLRTLARIEGEVELAVTGAVTQSSVLDALEARWRAADRHGRQHKPDERRRRSFMNEQTYRRFSVSERDRRWAEVRR